LGLGSGDQSLVVGEGGFALPNSPSNSFAPPGSPPKLCSVSRGRGEGDSGGEAGQIG